MKKGFTLMELIIVVVIVGILAMIGLPQFFTVAERGRAAEAFSALGALRSAQLRYAAESPSNTTTGVITQLDVEIPALRYFNNPTVAAVTDPSDAGSAGVIATIVRNDATNNYTCTITGGGAISCTGTGAPKNPQ